MQIENISAIPQEIDTVEKLYLWCYYQLSTNKERIDIEGGEEFVIDAELIRPDGVDPRLFLITKINLPIDENWLINGIKLWENAQEILSGLIEAPNLDDFKDLVVLWLKGDDFLDSSPKNQLVTKVGDVQISKEIFKYGTGSLKFINFSGATDYLQVSGSDFNFAHTTGDFTIEAWVYYTSDFFVTAPFAASSNPHFIQYAYRFYFRENTYTDITPSFNDYFRLNKWTHLAITREGSLYKIFLNGVLKSSGSKSTLGSNTVFTIGGLRSLPSSWGNLYMHGYIDSLRITKACRYTENFNPETDTYLAY